MEIYFIVVSLCGTLTLESKSTDDSACPLLLGWSAALPISHQMKSCENSSTNSMENGATPKIILAELPAAPHSGPE